MRCSSRRLVSSVQLTLDTIIGSVQDASVCILVLVIECSEISGHCLIAIILSVHVLKQSKERHYYLVDLCMRQWVNLSPEREP
jgi:hypothetical protein